MRRLFITLFILNLLNISSQNFDSLKVEAYKLKSDTDRVNFFYKEGFANRSINAQYSYNCAKQAEAFAQITNLPYYIAKSNNLLGILYYRKGDLNTALSYHKKALALRTTINDKKGIALSQTNLGNIFSELALYKLAENAYLKALEINNELNSPNQIDNCLLNLGVLSADLKMINVAENYFNRALNNSTKRNDYEIQASCLNNLAVINTAKQDFDAAIAKCYNSIKVKNLMDNEMEMADSYLNIAVAYIKKKEAKLALENLLIADSIILKFNYLAAKTEALKIYSEYYELEKNFESSLVYLKKSTFLKDSLEKANREIRLENTFVEKEIISNPLNETKEKQFPIIYFTILCVLTLLIALFILKFKR